MNFFKLLILSVVTAVQAKVLNFTQYESEWVKGKEYNLQYTYLEEPTFSNFQIRLYNSTKSITLDEISTKDFNEKDIHTLSLEYPEASTGRYKIVGLSNGNEISNNFSVKLVLKASTKTTNAPSPTETAANSTNMINKLENSGENGNSSVWKTIAIIVSILVVLLVLVLLGIIFYNRYKKNKKYEEEANTSIWKVPISERSINRGGVNAYSVPNASITERDLSFSSDIDGFYSYSSQYRNPEYYSTHIGYTKERKEKTKSIYSYSTNVTKVSNNILDILYPSNEKKEKEKSLLEKSLHEKSLHEKSELSIELGNSHSQKVTPRRKKHSNSPTTGQPRIVSSRSTERARSNSEVRTRSNSFKANAMLNRKSRVSLAESLKNTHAVNAALLNENVGEITSNVNNNTSAIPISSASSPTSLQSVSALKNDKNFNEAAQNPESPEYYIKHTKLNKKYNAVCSFKPSLVDEMSISKNDVIVIHEVFTDGWGLGKNITTDKEGLLPLNCLNIEIQ